jgi:myo-inositol 2-dehydrogenase / D-chiro-inositol 1-dehydrogenase
MTPHSDDQRISLPRASRRGFLNKSMCLAAGTAAGVSLARSAHAAGDETIKIALVGCGSRGTGAASQALRTKGPVKLWAMADLFADRLESSLANLTKGEKADYDRDAYQGFAGRVDVPPERRFVGFDAYEKAVASGVDMVILATPPQFRPTHYEHAVNRGKHVFMEKPLAVDAPGIRQVLQANQEAKRKNLKVVVGLMYRHNVRFQETVKRLQDGAIGSIPLMRCYWNMGLMRETAPRPPEMTEMTYQLRNPYHFLWLSGDYFADALLHFLDVCCWLKGTHPASAQGQGGRLVHTETQRGDTYDHHFVEFRFADGSIMAAQTRQIAGCWNISSVHAHGATGSAEIDHAVIRGDRPWRFHGNATNPYQVEHDVLFDAIRNDRPHNEVDYAATSTMTAIMGRMASYSGQLVRWEAAIGSPVRLGPMKCDFDTPAPVIADAQGKYPLAIPGVTKVF